MKAEAIIFLDAALRKSSSFRENCAQKGMENRYGLYSPGSSGWTSLNNEEFQEEDVWEAFQKIQDSISRDKATCMSQDLQHPAGAMPSTPGKYAYATEPEVNQLIRRRSTPPLSISICSNTYDNSRFWLDAGSNKDDNNRGFARNRWNSVIEEDDYDVGGREIEVSTLQIPPHVWIAKKIRPSSSVCEGAGRTLKGRDLLSVRNAVLNKTGFLEPRSSRW